MLLVYVGVLRSVALVDGKAFDALELLMLSPWSHSLANLYWLKRYCRSPDQNCRRRIWRKIAAEKKRLLSEGVEYLELHLVCRHLTNPRNQNAADRLRSYYAQGRLFG